MRVVKVTCDPRNLAAVECQTQAESCSEDQFHCGSGECVDIGQLCDGAAHCQDKRWAALGY